MKKLLLSMLGILASFPAMSQDSFYCKVNDFYSLEYVILDENVKTCEVFRLERAPGTDTKCDIVIPSQVEYGNNEYTVVSIAPFAFEYAQLSSISIPSTVAKIGENAFDWYNKIDKVEFASIEHLCSIDFDGEESNPLGVAKSLYLAGEEVVDLIIPNTVTEIKDYAFYKSASVIANIELSDSIESIGNYSFSSSPLRTVNLPNTLTSVGDYAFASSSNLKSVVIPSSLVRIGASAFWNCSLERMEFESLEHLLNIEFGDVYSKCGRAIYIGGKEIPDTLVIPNTIHEIKILALSDCKIVSVEIPNSVTAIRESAFSYCDLTSVNIGDSVALIDTYAFGGCTRLSSIQIGKSIRTIGPGNFSDCSKLRSIKISAANPPEADNFSQFDYEVYNQATLLVPENSKSAYESHKVWGRFQNIETFDPDAAIEETEADENYCEVYTISGLKVGNTLDGLPKGVYIVRQGSKVSKIII
ncbi:MAG: leucine-rich repeat domain-containing protein [Muribaculaceae bacterium]|nr:leucine-rich repeat domain-containing protein [Muribaculaceae bacterium]